MTTKAVKISEQGSQPWEKVSPAQKWLALIFVFLASTFNLLDRQVIGILAERIKLDLRLSDTELGLLTGTAFGIMYAFFTVPISRLSDHGSRTRLIAVAISLWSVLTICCGLALNFGQLIVARMGVGIGEAGSQPAASALIADYFPPRQRGLAMAVFYLGVPLGGCLGLLVGAVVGSRLGWRDAFFFAGAPGMVLGLLIWTCLRDPREPSAATVPRGSFLAGLGRAVRHLVVIRSWRLLAMASVAGAAIQNMAAAWFPVYLVRVHRMSLIEAATWMSIAVAAGGTLGSIGSGWACDRLRTRVRRPEVLILRIAFVILCPAIAFTSLADNKITAVIGLLITYPFAFAFLTPATLLVQQAAPDEMRGLAVGLWSSVMNVVSLTIVLPLIGLGSDLFTTQWGMRGLAYSLACTAIIPLAGAWLFAAAGRALDAQTQFA